MVGDSGGSWPGDVAQSVKSLEAQAWRLGSMFPEPTEKARGREMKAGESLGLASCHWARSTSSRLIERLSLILIQRLRKTSNINLCLSGHAHTYKQTKPGKKNCDPHNQFCPVLTCKALSLYLVWEIRLSTLPVPREFMWGLFELILA